MKRMFGGMVVGFGACLVLLWLVSIDGTPLAQTALAQSTVPEPTIYDQPIPETIESPTLSRDVLEYGRLVYISSRRIASGALVKISPLLFATKESDTEWVLASNQILAALMQSAQQELAAIEPPPSTRDAHQILLGALQDCSQSAHSAGQGLETIQPDYMRQALERMNQCAHEVATATDMLLAIGNASDARPGGAGTTTLPAPTAMPTVAPTTVAPTAVAPTTVAPTLVPAATSTTAPTVAPTVVPTMIAPTAAPTIAPIAPLETLTETQAVQPAAPVYLFDPTLILDAPATCDCSTKRYWCANFTTQADAQICYDRCQAQVNTDVHGLDPDLDGVACEER